jgi:hypothetical protein
MAKRKKPQPTISTYRPGIVEKVTDSTIGAGLRQIHRLSGKSERDANRLAGDVMRNIEDLTGLKAAERSARKILKGKGGAADYATVGVAALPVVGGKIGRQAVKRANAPSTPSVTNRMYSEKILGPEYKPGDALPKYGYRNVSTAAEVDDIAKSGYMRPAPGKKANKYFTMSDAEVPSAGNRGASKPVIRVPSDRIPQGSPVRSRDVQLWDNATESWKQIKRKANGGEMNVSRSNITAPVKKAAGGVAKVRKGMATPEGKIIDAMNKIRGK